MRTYTVLGRKVKAHDEGCAQSYREDRRAGLIYPAFQTADGPIAWAEASVRYGFCVYCGAHDPTTEGVIVK